MALTEFQTKLAELVAKNAGATDWGDLFLEMLASMGLTINELSLEKAPATHAHPGGTSEVMGIGPDSARPAGVEGFVFSNTDTGRLEILDVDGNVQTDIAPMPGYIAGMQLSRASDNSVSIQPGVCEIGGKLYVLESAVTISVNVASGLTWRAVYIAPPSSGNALSASDFYNTDTLNIGRSADGTFWHYTEYPAYRVIGMYPTSAGVVDTDFRTANGLYYTYLEVINDSSPPTVVTSYNMGMPNIGENLMGQFSTLITADASTTKINFYMQNITTLGGEGNDHRGVTTGQSGNGYMALRAYTTGGSPTLLLMYLMTVTIPTGMAR